MKLTSVLLLCFAVANTLSIDRKNKNSNSKVVPRLFINEQINNQAVSGRISNGTEAEPKHFPHMVALNILKHDGFHYSCGGVIISDRWILTAAHCTVNAKYGVDVSIGGRKRDEFSEPEQVHVSVSNKYIYNHEKYNYSTVEVTHGKIKITKISTFLNDIALIKLPVILEFNEYIQPVNFPKKVEHYLSYVDKAVVVPGWGRHGKNELHDKKLLRWIQSKVLQNNICAKSYYPGVITSAHICLSVMYGMGVCKGDSGGPMLLADASRNLIGIVSFTGDTCGSRSPIVLTRTTSHLDWIEEKTGLTNN